MGGEGETNGTNYTSSKLHFFFFPVTALGRMIPMIDMAKLFALRGVKCTLLTTPYNAPSLQRSVKRIQKDGFDISILTMELPPKEVRTCGLSSVPMIDITCGFAAHEAASIILSAPAIQNSDPGEQTSSSPIKDHSIQLPENAAFLDSDMSAAPFTNTLALQELLRELLIGRKPDCIMVSVFNRWSAEVIDATGVPRIMFDGKGCFSRCAMKMLRTYKLDEGVGSELEPFVVPGLPHKIEMTRSQFPHFHRTPPGAGNRPQFSEVGELDTNHFGVVVNSFYDLEPEYVDLFRNELDTKAWLVGSLSLCNGNVEDKPVRGTESSIDEQTCLKWLNSKDPESVLYISFGSLVRVAPRQLLELALGLEASSQNFIWVIGKISGSEGDIEKSQHSDWLPDGFEETMRQSKRGLIIRGWAPQLLILEHPSMGGFMTHCGWNSTVEGVSLGVPMITFPISAEQFFNEKLIVDVLGIGVKSGSIEWSSWNNELSKPVGREKVEAAVRRLMRCGAEATEMRRRARELREKAWRAVEKGGSSYADADSLIRELQLRKIE